MTIQVTGREGDKGLILISEIEAIFECKPDNPENRPFVIINCKSGEQISVYDDYETLSKTYLEGLINA